MKLFLKILLVTAYSAAGIWFYRVFFSKAARGERADADADERESILRRSVEIHMEMTGERVPRTEYISGIESTRLEDHLAALDGVEAFLVAVPEGLA